jgi:hypothetical protein
VQLVLTSALHGVVSNRRRDLKKVEGGPAEDSAVDRCRLQGIGVILAAIGGFAINGAAIAGWFDLVSRIGDQRSLTLPFVAVVLVAVACLIVGSGLGTSLLLVRASKRIRTSR